MNALVLYPLLTVALYYLGARAMITRFFWEWTERDLPKLGAFLGCAACAGTWFGAFVGAFGYGILGWRFLGVDGALLNTILPAACAMVWTPILAAVHDRAMRELG